MPIVNDYLQVCEVYDEARERGVCLPCFCAEDMGTVEALLMAAKEFGEDIGVSDLPIIVAWTSRYPGRGQMRHITACGDVPLGNRLMFAILREMAAPGSPYADLRILPHLDHAYPWLDGDILMDHVDDFASVMFDASEKPFAENIQMTADYVTKVKGRVLVEGAADEVSEEGNHGKDELTSVTRAEQFLRETGVDLLVPNLGTEHRATQAEVRYASAQAEKIRGAIGSVMVLHGTSSVKAGTLGALAKDGIVKANVFTSLAKAGGQALAKTVLSDLGNVFDSAGLAELKDKGIVGAYYDGDTYKQEKCAGEFKPRLENLCNPPRRDAWVSGVKEQTKIFLKSFNCQLYGA